MEFVGRIYRRGIEHVKMFTYDSGLVLGNAGLYVSMKGVQAAIL